MRDKIVRAALIEACAATRACSPLVRAVATVRRDRVQATAQGADPSQVPPRLDGSDLDVVLGLSLFVGKDGRRVGGPSPDMRVRPPGKRAAPSGSGAGIYLAHRPETPQRVERLPIAELDRLRDLWQSSQGPVRRKWRAAYRTACRRAGVIAR